MRHHPFLCGILALMVGSLVASPMMQPQQDLPDGAAYYLSGFTFQHAFQTEVKPSPQPYLFEQMLSDAFTSYRAVAISS